ncbi:acid-sensing ion channel 2-like [Saccostrea cucullata]|uniref:acid-sensing ion channel 2-like n=1 Tax=Saccostrea cuccullata TaxID=36930 RepID=UPI002ED12D20
MSVRLWGYKNGKLKHTLRSEINIFNFIFRYIWMILTLAMTGALVAFIVEAFINFFKYTTITQVSAENKRNIDFPAVTVCNMNMVRNTITQCNGSVFANLDTLFLNYGETLVIEDRLTSELGYVVGEDPNGEEMLKCLYEYSNKVHEMMPICTWKGTLMNCSDLFQTTLTEMGVCFTFNGVEGQRLQASYTGPDGGLRMFVDIGQLNYYYSATIQAGIKVVLHDPGTDPLPSMGGFLVAPGLSAEAIISKTRKSFLGDPYGKCLKVSESGNPLKRYSFYSEKSCRMECMIDHLVSGNESCRNCRHFLHPGIFLWASEAN